MRGVRGFTLTELAVVMAIVALLLGGLMFTLSAQTEQRNFEETRQRLEAMREVLLSYAIVNGRLPCPAVCLDATCSAGGVEALVVPAATGGQCTNYYSGYFPARTVGYQKVDSNGYAVDAWGNRIRYAVSNTTWTAGAGMFTKQHATTSWSVGTSPADLVICASFTGITGAACNAAPNTNQVTNTGVVVAILFSTGKNGAVACTGCTDENANTNGDPVFVYHTPTPSTATNGEFDDQFTWLTVGELYSKMISAGVLP
jgi:prepilin-type N-terminal cleavage/methylation domain-containing protein